LWLFLVDSLVAEKGHLLALEESCLHLLVQWQSCAQVLCTPYIQLHVCYTSWSRPQPSIQGSHCLQVAGQPGSHVALLWVPTSRAPAEYQAA
jgi:hypothetical protein